MNKTLQLAALLLGAVFSTATMGEVYTYVDAEGNRVFTDRPKPGNATRIEMAPMNEMPVYQNRAAPKPEQQPPPAPAYQLLRILFPAPDSMVEDPAGNLMVTVNSEPALLPEHSYRLLLDGKDAGNSGRSAVFALENLDRGTHQLAVEIIDNQGMTLERTPSQPVHVRRMSLDAKRKVKPCQLADFGVRPECPLKDKPKPDNGIPFIPFI